eukprot:5845003-Amphidinium_carterae.1
MAAFARADVSRCPPRARPETGRLGAQSASEANKAPCQAIASQHVRVQAVMEWASSEVEPVVCHSHGTQLLFEVLHLTALSASFVQHCHMHSILF